MAIGLDGHVPASPGFTNRRIREGGTLEADLFAPRLCLATTEPWGVERAKVDRHRVLSSFHCQRVGLRSLATFDNDRPTAFVSSDILPGIGIGRRPLSSRERRRTDRVHSALGTIQNKGPVADSANIRHMASQCWTACRAGAPEVRHFPPA
jgi:hypothetical protein